MKVLNVYLRRKLDDGAVDMIVATTIEGNIRDLVLEMDKKQALNLTEKLLRLQKEDENERERDGKCEHVLRIV
jgi:hypothetical protein